MLSFIGLVCKVWIMVHTSWAVVEFSERMGASEGVDMLGTRISNKTPPAQGLVLGLMFCS